MAGLFQGTGDYPGFNPLGLILGGQGYASSYFSNKNQFEALRMKELRDRQEMETYANGVFGSPELKSSVTNPDDQMAQWATWRRMNQQAPEEGRKLGADILTQSLGGIFQRKSIAATGIEQRKSARFETDENIREYKAKQDLDAKLRAKMIEDMLTPDPATGATGTDKAAIALQRTLAAKAAGYPIKEGYNVGFDAANGGIYQTPAIGTPDYISTQTKLQDFANLNQWGQQLQVMFERGTDRTQYNAVRDNMIGTVRRAEETGTLDAGTTEYINKLLPDYWGTGPAYVMDRGTKEKLRVFSEKQKLSFFQLQASTRLPLAGPTPDDMIPPPPVPTAKQARESLEKQLPPPEPSVSSGRGRPAITYEKKSSAGPGVTLPKGSGKNPRAYTVR